MHSDVPLAQPGPALSSVQALVFDTFGTVVDWRSSVAAEVDELAKRKGFAVDGAKFADAWRVRSLIRRYSDHIGFPVKMRKEGEASLEYETVNEAKAAKLFRLAADQGNPVAQNRLARLYANGVVVKADPVQAAKWHLLAREAGVSDFSLDVVLAKLTKEQREQAEQAAEDWRNGRLSKD